MYDVKAYKPKNAGDLRERVRNLKSGEIVHFVSGGMTINSIRTVVSSATLVLNDRGFMSKRVGDAVVIARYV